MITTARRLNIRLLLAPLSAAYAAVIRARNALYDRGLLPVHSAGVPVVSVGNLTVGGTGKTPLVIEIARKLCALGHRPAILTRGYRGRADEPADEVREFALALPDVPVVVDPDRVAGAATARARHAADCLVLDDGFQHRRLRRDLDIVLIDALDAWGGGWLLPAGRLREPRAGLRRAHLILITRANQVAPGTRVDVQRAIAQHAPQVPVLQAAVHADQLVGADGRVRPASDLAQSRVLPVCGLGNPGTFLRLLAAAAPDRAPPLVYPDHHGYSAADATAIVAAARRQRAARVVTTRKDWVKLVRWWAERPAADRPELLRLEIRLTLDDPAGELEARLRRLFEERR